MISKEISNKLIKTGIIPVFYNDDIEISKSVIKACYDGGMRVFEYTNRGSKAYNNFKELKQFADENCKGMSLGIGSIVDEKQAQDFIDINADFIVSPIFSKEIAETCNKQGIFWIPGCATLTEMANASKLGAEIVKAFPGNVLGPGFVKAVLGPMPWLKIMPTGGVTPERENLKSWFDAGVVCVGIGSQLLNKETILQPQNLTAKIKEVLKIKESLIKV